MKLNVWRVTAFLLLIALSVAFGFAYDAITTAVERQKHPRPTELSALVQDASEQYGIPEAIVWATVKENSDFASNAVSQNGRIGLMQLTPEQFAFISQEVLGKETPDVGLLYSPETNLNCGVAWLSYLYEHYGVWDLVFAAYHAGTDTVDAWLTSPKYTDENGVLTEIPDKTAASYVKSMNKAVDLYRKLYYEQT